MTTIDIVSDLVCPWCYIGLRRLDAAIAEVRRERPDFSCEKRWLPFFLNPDTPPEGEPYLPFLEKKFGGPAPVLALFERVRAAGRPWGVDYAFEKIEVRANTLQAHRLIHWAQQRGDAARLVERLFVAQFQRGERIGDVALLAQVAVECGYPGAEVERYLASGADIEEVRTSERCFRAMGISMVPTFIVDGRQVVVGAEDPAVLAAAINKTLA
ncbi:MAG: DsbA family oxidoreductase [Betaproteobacteria bacterium HGW-Betaproteobacteria-4]|jgi:predicted DsbA family dithiol-disulfide isomerase|nr:MAG: DsbA family oxidoreductase [Betaproteobacteria bacterium HGW-Betaproteobacteria-4]